jgi:hypothetical protein
MVVIECFNHAFYNISEVRVPNRNIWNLNRSPWPQFKFYLQLFDFCISSGIVRLRSRLSLLKNKVCPDSESFSEYESSKSWNFFYLCLCCFQKRLTFS